jgi:uncharacterized hydrophobic protein (TIGR00271 family)
MLHLRITVPAAASRVVVDRLRTTPGVAHLAHLPGASVEPEGDLVLCDVAREAANEVVEWLQHEGVHRTGAITIEAVESVVSDHAARAESVAPGHGADALVWEEVEARARAETQITVSFLVFMAISAVIAAIGILLDAPILIVGAMVVGPEYGPIAALCIAAVRWRRAPMLAAGSTLAVGFAVAAGAALVATLAFRATGVAPEGYSLGTRELTAFIAHPDAMAAVVAVLAGVVGMLSLTEGRSGTLIGVLVSVTTIPAVANVGVAAAYEGWGELRGAALQLAINLIGLTLAGAATLAIQAGTTRAAPSGTNTPRRVRDRH